MSCEAWKRQGQPKAAGPPATPGETPGQQAPHFHLVGPGFTLLLDLIGQIKPRVGQLDPACLADGVSRFAGPSGAFCGPLAVLLRSRVHPLPAVPQPTITLS